MYGARGRTDPTGPGSSARFPRQDRGRGFRGTALSTLAIVALVVLAVVAAALVVVAAIRAGRARRPSGPGEAAARKTPGWYEILLAIVLVLAIVVLAVSFAVEVASGDAAAEGWRAGTRSDLFLGVMLAIGALSLLFLLVFLLARLPAGGRPPADGGGAAGSGSGAVQPDTIRDPAGSRLLGLLLLVVGILLLGWVYLDPAARADLMGRVLYPAAVAVAIVLLFDKATRSWTPKPQVEGFREWLLCDLILITLVLGLLNLEQLEARDAYGGFFWDMVHVAAFFLVFWCLDRTSMRGRFLVGFGYLALLPLLLVLWRWVQEIEAPAGLAWWSTVWPVFFLALTFFVLEIITLLVLRENRGHAVPAVKDALFVVLYAIFLIVAVPAAE